MYFLHVTQDIGMVTRMLMYGGQGMITRNELVVLVYCWETAFLFLLKGVQRFFCGKRNDVEGSYGVGHEQFASHLVGHDAHVEAQVDLDAGVDLEF